MFETVEISLDRQAASLKLSSLPDTQVHDACDADRDGRFVRLALRFRTRDRTLVVPAFAMRDEAGGPWRWRVRWSAPEAARWVVDLQADVQLAPDQARVRSTGLVGVIEAVADPAFTGPLVAPKQGENPRYLRRLKPDGSSEALWLFGACRAWNVRGNPSAGDWAPHEWIDRDKELFPVMREAGYNVLSQWMAPWEYLLVHHARAEFWRNADDTWRRVPIAKDAAWSPWQCYDQGRAADFDKLLAQCEGDKARRTIHMMLAPIAHQSLQSRSHLWGWQESGWSPGDDAGKQSLQKLNGFSAFRETMDVWDFFKADPAAPLDDWRSQLFDHQANFWHYLIARWGASRALGMWVLIDELDGIGDRVGVMALKRGWWAHPDCERWLADTIRLFRGGLTRSDGFRYAGDPYRHPLHAATTSWGGEFDRGGNLDWPGGPEGSRPDLMGWHWYPWWGYQTTYSRAWTHTIAGVVSYAQAPIDGRPRLISEFGAQDRYAPEDTPSHTYPSLYHMALWPAIMTGQAGTPMDWDDGKEFGELRWREREGVFDPKRYPVDNAARLKALRRFLGDLSPEHLAPCRHKGTRVTLTTQQLIGVYALHATRGAEAVYGWVFSPEGDGAFAISGLKPGAYRLQWFDPWTGDALPDLKPQRVAAAGAPVPLDAGPALARLADAWPVFPTDTRLARGQDAAFKLLAAE